MLYKYVKSETRPLRNLKIKPLNLAISFVCLTFGLFLLAYSFYPYINSYIRPERNKPKALLTPSIQRIEKYETLVEKSQEADSNYITNVNRNFNVVNKVLNINQKTFPEYADIKGDMKISIPAIKLEKLNVQINVDSFDDKSYLPILDKNLGHFKGTSLPDKPGNTFIYGHSANEILARANTNNPKYAFSFLGNLEIGDEVLLEHGKKTYKYVVQKFRIVQPEDISPIYTNSSERILTLMTCWIPGVGNERLIIQAKLIDEQ
jgi:LPXTG-site transpeptidase (sortase) family protein